MAVAAIAERLEQIVATNGPQAILNAHYTGTISLLAFLFPSAVLQSPRRHRSLPGHDLQHGRARCAELRLRDIGGWFRSAHGSRYALDRLVGRQPVGLGPHVHEHWLRESAAPRSWSSTRSALATAEAADLHLQPFPGSDAAWLRHAARPSARRPHRSRFIAEPHRSVGRKLEPLLADCTPAWGEATTGVPARPDRRGRPALRLGPHSCGSVRGSSASRRWQRDARLCSAACGDRQSGQTGRRSFSTSTWLRRATSRRCISDRRPPADQAPPPVSHMDLAACLEDPADAGADLLEHQRRRLEPAASDGCGGRSHARISSRSCSTCSRPTPPISPTSCCRPRASWSSTISLTLVLPADAVGPGQSDGTARATRCRIRRSSAAWPARWATASRSCSRPTPIIDTVLRGAGIVGMLRRVGRHWHRAGRPGAGDPVRGSELPHAERADRDRLGTGRRRRPSARTSAARPTQTGGWPAAPAHRRPPG